MSAKRVSLRPQGHLLPAVDILVDATYEHAFDFRIRKK